MNIDIIPLQDGFETTLAQAYDGQLGTFKVNESPSFTFTAELTSTYAVIEPGKTNMQIVEFNAYDPILKTITVNNITLEKGSNIPSVAVNHPVQSKVIISDNYEFWKKILDAINSKLGNDGSNGSTTFDLTISGSLFRIRLDGSGNMKFTDDNNAEISLSTIAAAAGADRKVAATLNDTTPGNLTDKLTVGDGLDTTLLNPGGNEQYEVAVDLITTNGLKITAGQLDVEPSTNIQVGTQRIATDAEATAAALETVTMNPKQVGDNYQTTMNWILVGQQEWSTESSAKSVTVTGGVNKMYKVFVYLQNTGVNVDPNLKLNSIATGYNYQLMSDTALSVQTAQTQFDLMTNNARTYMGEINISGISNTESVAGDVFLVSVIASGRIGENYMVKGDVDAGSITNLTNIEITPAGVVQSGYMKVYEITLD